MNVFMAFLVCSLGFVVAFLASAICRNSRKEALASLAGSTLLTATLLIGLNALTVASEFLNYTLSPEELLRFGISNVKLTLFAFLVSSIGWVTPIVVRTTFE